MKKIDLVIIDPQNSFCKVVDPAEQQQLHDGELCVPGAWDDMARVGEFIKNRGSKLNDIHVTMDSHHQLHIAHPMWYRNSAGQPPNPFTSMRNENGVIVGSEFDANGNPQDVGEFTTHPPSFTKWTLHYLDEIAKSGRYPHLVWPPHCLIGTPGHNIVSPLLDALFEWERQGPGMVDIVTKGSNYRVEHFSAVRAEVVDPEDPTTQLNTQFISTLMDADEILLTGEAGSHCLANTVRDIANEFASDDSFIKKCVLLEDATSPVPNFENLQEDFIKEMTSRGMRVSSTTDYLN